MGINRVFGKVKSFVKNTVGENTINGIKKVLNATSIKPQYSCSIGSVLGKVLGESEIGDKFEHSDKKDNKTQEQQQKKENTVKENKTQTAVTSKPAPVVETKPTETSKPQTNTKAVNKEEKSTVTDKQLEDARKALREKCIASDINYGALMINITAITGKNIREFRQVDKNLQLTLISYIMKTIDRVNEVNLPDVKKLDAVVTDAALLFEFVTHDENGNVRNFENISPEELKNGREEFNKRLKKRREEKMAEIEKLPESERAAAREALKEELAGYRQHIFDELKRKIPFESAIELILVVSIKDLGEKAQELMESYPVEIREKIANTLQSPETFKEYLRTVKGECDELTEKELDAIAKFHKIFGTYKTKENLEAYEASYQESRKNGEFSEDIYKATEMGIGQAAYANINMTSEEKEAFIQNWVSNNDGFLSDSDMAQVEESAKEYIEELLNKNPEIKNNFQTVKRSIQEIVEKTLNRVFEDKREASKEKKTKEANAQIKKLMTSPSGKVHTLNKVVLSHAQQYIRKEAAKFETPAIKKSTEQIEFALVSGIITEKQALKNLDNSEHKFIKMCVQNSRLASKYDERINLYIKNEKDVEKLKSIAAVAPHDIVIKIVQNMRGNRERLTDKLIKNHEVDFNTKVLLEKYTAEHAA